MSTIKLEIKEGADIAAALRAAFGQLRVKRVNRVELRYSTISSKGKFIITSQSDLDKHLAAFERAQNGKGEFTRSQSRENVVIGPK